MTMTKAEALQGLEGLKAMIVSGLDGAKQVVADAPEAVVVTPVPPAIAPAPVLVIDLPKTSPIIDVVNHSTVVDDATVQKWCDAQQKQIDRDFHPVWGLRAILSFRADKTIRTGNWGVAVVDDSDQAGALGYHDETADGQPLGTVAAHTAIKSNSSPSVTFSHEVLELIMNPWIFDLAGYLDDQGAHIYTKEAADACEDDSLAVNVDGVLLSDFVFPAFFDITAKQGSRFDYQNKITAPFQILPGGYLGVMDVKSNTWTQINARETPDAVHVGSRWARRVKHRHQWRRSTR